MKKKTKLPVMAGSFIYYRDDKDRTKTGYVRKMGFNDPQYPMFLVTKTREDPEKDGEWIYCSKLV